MAKARVYFTREITPQAMDRLYDALGIRLSGKTAVKISTGEPGGHNFLQPALIGPLTERLHGTIVECNTAYEGRRNTTQEHWKAIQEHGFLDIAPPVTSWMKPASWHCLSQTVCICRKILSERTCGITTLCWFFLTLRAT